MEMVASSRTGGPFPFPKPPDVQEWLGAPSSFMFDNYLLSIYYVASTVQTAGGVMIIKTEEIPVQMEGKF